MNMSLQNPTATMPQTDDDLAAYLKRHYRMYTTEELALVENVYGYVLELAEAERDEWPARITENSRREAAAVLVAVRAERAWRETRGMEHPKPALGWPRELLDDLKARVPIQSEIGRTVALRRSGSRLRGCCPFHNSASGTSLVVFPDDGGWWCFGCQTGGDVFAWTQAIGRMTFAESVHYLAAVAGVELPQKPRHTRRRVFQIGGQHAE